VKLLSSAQVAEIVLQVQGGSSAADRAIAEASLAVAQPEDVPHWHGGG
jgi:hypothetical protein